MKNSILFLFATIAFAFFGNAQYILDDFESYNLGDMGIQNPAVWSTWTGVPDSGENIEVVDNIVFEGTKAGFIGPDSNQNVLLLLGNVDPIEDYDLNFEMYIPAGGTAYFNIQGQTETNVNTGYEGAGAGGAGVFNSGDLYFNKDGLSPGVFVDETTGEIGSYPEDIWFPVYLYFDDFNNEMGRYTIAVDGTRVNNVPVPFQSDDILGAINFSSIDGDTNYFIDVVYFQEVYITGIDDFSVAHFKIFPNPVTDVLHIESATVIDEIQVYNVLGKLILKDSPQAISPRMDMSALSTGVYLIRVSIGDTSKTFKVVK